MNFVKYLPLLAILFLVNCKRQPKIRNPLPPETYFVLEKVDVLPDSLIRIFPEWVQPGMECYGMAEIVDSKGEYEAMRFPIPCKIISFHTNGVKCKVTTNVYPFQNFGCNAIGIRRGTKWMETDGVLFLTKKDAVLAINNNRACRKHTVER